MEYRLKTTINHESSKGTILIVDDASENLYVLNEFLTDKVYFVRRALSGSLAIDSARVYPPDLILLDIKMSEISGIGLGLKIIQESIRVNKSPIWAESEVEEGSTFIVTFPTAKTNQYTFDFS